MVKSHEGSRYIRPIHFPICIMTITASYSLFVNMGCLKACCSGDIYLFVFLNRGKFSFLSSLTISWNLRLP